MLEILRSAIDNRFGGDIGAIAGSQWLFDADTAAYTSLRDIFPEATVKICLFHMRKAINTKKDTLGLATPYKDPNDLHIYHFIRNLISLALLPVDLVVPVANDILNNPLQGYGPRIDSAIIEFAIYFR